MDAKPLLLLCLLGGAGYLGYQNRAAIWEATGLGEIEPGRVRAIDMAKDAYSLDRLRKNVEWLRERVQQLGGEAQGWRVEGNDVRALDVIFEFTAPDEEGLPQRARYVFRVDASGKTDVELRAAEDPFDGAPQPPR